MTPERPKTPKRPNTRKRPPRPMQPTSEDQAPAYPTVREEGVTRRAFLGAALAGGTALAGISAVPVAQARSHRPHPGGFMPRPRHTFHVTISPPYECRHCKVAVGGVRGVAYSAPLAAFFNSHKERRALLRIVRGALASHHHPDLGTPRGRARIAAKITKAFGAHYRRRTGRKAPYFRLWLHLRPPAHT